MSDTQTIETPSPFVEDQYAEARERVAQMPEAATRTVTYSLYRKDPGTMTWNGIEKGPAEAFSPFEIADKYGPGRYVVQLRFDGLKGNRAQVEFSVGAPVNKPAAAPLPAAPATQVMQAAPIPSVDVDAIGKMAGLNIKMLEAMSLQAMAAAQRSAEATNPLSQVGMVMETFKALRELDPKRAIEKSSSAAEWAPVLQSVGQMILPALNKVVDRLTQPAPAVRVVNAAQVAAAQVASVPQAPDAVIEQAPAPQAEQALDASKPAANPDDSADAVRALMVALRCGAKAEANPESYGEIVGDALDAAGVLEMMLQHAPGELCRMVVENAPELENHQAWLAEVEKCMRDMFGGDTVATIGKGSTANVNFEKRTT